MLILTAMDTVDDRIKGLDAGADDYLVKPFDMGELAARLRALIRRASGKIRCLCCRLPVSSLIPPPIVCCTGTNRSSCRPKEFAVLHALMLNAGKVLSRAQTRRAALCVGRGGREQCGGGAHPSSAPQAFP